MEYFLKSATCGGKLLALGSFAQNGRDVIVYGASDGND